MAKIPLQHPSENNNDMFSPSLHDFQHSGRNRSWRHPKHDEVLKHFLHYRNHMAIDFLYHNEMIFSETYMEILLSEWIRVAVIDDIGKNGRNRGGFITLVDFVLISKRMLEIHGIRSWELTSSELRNVSQEEFSNENEMSLRRFCQYVEREEIYDDEENALRVIRPQDYYVTMMPSPLQKTNAYIGDNTNYDTYHQCCCRQLAMDLRLEGYSNEKICDIVMFCVRAFEAEDPDRTGYIDRESLLRVLYQLAVVKSDSDHQNKNSAVRLLCTSVPILQKRRSDYHQDNNWIGNDDTNSIIAAKTDELDAILRIDSELGYNMVNNDYRDDCNISAIAIAGREGPFKVEATTIPHRHHGKMHSSSPHSYRVSLRQFCVFIERPIEDYCCFPTKAFQEQIQYSKSWSPILHRVLLRYYRRRSWTRKAEEDTYEEPLFLFHKQIMTLLLMDHRGVFGPIGQDVLFVIFGFLPRGV